MSKKNRIRVLSLAVIRNGAAILSSQGHDGKKQEDFYRLLGGGVDFGERSEEALIREFQEELDAKIRVLRLLTVVENLFTFEGQEGHEICFIHEAEFVDGDFYRLSRLPLVEESFRGRFAVWVDPAETKRIYPVNPFELRLLPEMGRTGKEVRG